jgi:hypothetical protein
MVVISRAYKLNKIWHLYVTFLCYSRSGDREKEIEYHLSSGVNIQLKYVRRYTRLCLPAYNLFELMSVPVPLYYFYRSSMYQCMIILF